VMTMHRQKMAHEWQNTLGGNRHAPTSKIYMQARGEHALTRGCWREKLSVAE